MNYYKQCMVLMLLIENKKVVTLREVVAHLYPKNKKVTFSSFKRICRTISGDGLYGFKESDSKKYAPLKEACLESPDDYIFEFNHFDRYENCEVHSTKPNLLFEEDSQTSEQYYFADVKLSKYFGLNGSKEGANTLYERVRVFTNFFANSLAHKNYELTNSLFTKVASEKYSVEYLDSFITKQEKKIDSIKFYDNVQVCSIYNGEITDPEVDLMTLPKGSKAEQRVGVSRFKLVFSHTPNGVTIFGQDVQIDILEEDGRFKVFNFYCVN